VRAGESTRSSIGRQYSAFQVQGAIQVRIKNTPALALAMMLIGTSASIAQSAPADDSPLRGNWQLVVLPVSEDAFAILTLIEIDGKATATVTDADKMLEKDAVKGVDRKNDLLTIILTGPETDTTFKGMLAKHGGDAGKFHGTIKFRGRLCQARLEKTEQSYLSDFTKTSKFPTALPEIKLDNLAVVAFVQDDGDKSILHAVSVPVETAGP
jgi:hypothetical protein